MMGNYIYVLDVDNLWTEIFQEGHKTHAMHTDTMKMYRNLRSYYQWPTMKKEMVEFISRLDCQALATSINSIW